MKPFLLKYKRTIIFWTVLLFIILFFAPRQHDYYLDDDISVFKHTRLPRILLWTGIAISITILVLALVKTKSLKQSAITFVSAGVMIAFFFFIFQNVLLGLSLFINRQFTRGNFQKTYVANYMAGSDQTKEHLFPIEVSTNRGTTDNKLINKIYRPGLKQNDTVMVTFNKGLFGIAFQEKPLADE